ncbi:MAG: IclR family transcriptional regulator [Gemmatimonadota bacterium]
MSRVQAVHRAFLVMEQLASAEMGLTELATATDLPKSTIARLLHTLQYEDAVEQDQVSGRYRIGPSIASLAGTTDRSSDLISRARPHLVVLAQESGEDAGFAVPDGHRVHYVAQTDSDNQIQIRDWTGERLPMHAVASGLAILAHWPDEALERYLDQPLRAYTENTTTSPAELRERLEQTRRDGFVWVHQELVEGLNAVAAPILDKRGRPHGALHIHGPAYRFPQPDRAEAVATLVVEKAQLITDQLDAG